MKSSDSAKKSLFFKVFYNLSFFECYFFRKLRITVDQFVNARRFYLRDYTVKFSVEDSSAKFIKSGGLIFPFNFFTVTNVSDE